MSATDTQVNDERRSRRSVLGLLAAGGGAAVAALLGRPEQARAADGDPLILGTGNSAESSTGLAADIDPGFVFSVSNFGSGKGAGGIVGATSGHKPALAGESDAGEDSVAVLGASNGPGGFATGVGTGVQGVSGSGPGVVGSSGSGTGVTGESDTGVGGFFGTQSGLALAVRGPGNAIADIEQGSVFQVRNTSPGEGAHALRGLASGGKPAVAGETDASFGVGVLGASSGPGFGEAGHYGEGDGTGVRGDSGSGPGVHGFSDTGIGGFFESPNGAGLEVWGRSVFSTAGAGFVPAGQNAVVVADDRVTETSHISVTLASDPGPRQLHWIDRIPGQGFRVNLTSAAARARPKTAFTYLIVEPVGSQG